MPDVVHRHVVGRDDARLGTALDGHVREGEPALHREVGDGVAAVLHGHVEGPVVADLGDDLQDHVLAHDPAARLAGVDDPEGLGDPQPDLAGGEHPREVRRAHAGREAAERPVRAGVGVGADDHVTGGDEPVLGQQDVLDARTADLVEVGDLLLAGEGPHPHPERCRGDVLGRHEVRRHEGDAVPVPHLGHADLAEGVDGHGSGDVVGHRQAHLRHDEVAGAHALPAAGTGEDLLGDGAAVLVVAHQGASTLWTVLLEIARLMALR